MKIQIISFTRRDNQRGEKWVNRCIFCYYCNALLDPISLQHPADEENDLYFQSDDSSIMSHENKRRKMPFCSDSYFESRLLPHLLQMTEDNITNVKICATRTIKNILTNRPYFQNKESKGKKP